MGERRADEQQGTWQQIFQESPGDKNHCAQWEQWEAACGIPPGEF